MVEYTNEMAKILVLVHGAAAPGSEVVATAEAVVAGGRQVRFAEVGVRAAGNGSLEPDGAKYRALDSFEILTSADALILVGRDPAALAGVLAEAGPLMDRVVAALDAAGGPDWATMEALAARGALLVPFGAAHRHDALTDARLLGARVAKVAGWIRHVKGHEADDAHGGGHGHDHDHAHGHHHH